MIGGASEVLARAEERRAEERRYLCERLDERCIEIIGRRFGVHQACFQGVRGQYDPLDAMRRDAFREVYAWLRKERRAFRKEEMRIKK